jgi:hypothetical protein
MNWLSENYKWVFDGIGAAALIGLIAWLWRRFFKEPAEKTNTSLTAKDSQVTNSPVASGSGIIQNVIHVGSAPVTPVPATPLPVATRPRPNIQMTGTSVVTALVRDWVWKENESGTDQAAVIQFTNEARSEGRNVGGHVKASLVYKNDGHEVLRIVGSWLHEAREYAEFRVDESHKLMVGIRYNQQLCVIGRRRVIERGFATVKPEVQDLPNVETVSVRLTNADTGDFLYEGKFRVTIDPLRIIPSYVGQGDVTL